MGETIARLRATDPIEKITTHLKEAGAVIVEDLVDAETLARFNAEIDEVMAATPDGREVLSEAHRGFFGEQTRHITGVAAKSRTFAEKILCNPVLLSVCDEILLPACVNYRLNIAHVLDRGPGSVQQFLHRDELVWCQVPEPHPELQLASIIALEEFTAENGATRIAPGSHRWPRDRQPEPEEVVAAEMPAGAAVLYLGSTIHGGGPNTTTGQRRRGMHLSFNLGWLRTEENNYLTTPPEIARTLPRRAQELLGYAAHDAMMLGGGYLGTVDTRDPIDLLESGEL
jgi:ectoine hydroxylase-related dioxygenase (phytanoyl-CoA dioxygenase family)